MKFVSISTFLGTFLAGSGERNKKVTRGFGENPRPKINERKLASFLLKHTRMDKQNVQNVGGEGLGFTGTYVCVSSGPYIGPMVLADQDSGYTMWNADPGCRLARFRLC